jgi:hypothetical protein
MVLRDRQWELRADPDRIRYCIIPEFACLRHRHGGTASCASVQGLRKDARIAHGRAAWRALQ